MNRRPHAFRASNLIVLTLATATLFPSASFALSTHEMNKPQNTASLRGATAGALPAQRVMLGTIRNDSTASPSTHESGVSLGYKTTNTDKGWSLSLDAKTRRDNSPSNDSRDLGVTVNARLTF